MPVTTEDLSRVVKHILASPQMLFVTKLMQQDVARKKASAAEQYAALAASQRHLARHVADAARRSTRLEYREADADRRARLDELAGRFPGVVDLADEHQRCLYSAGSQMDNDQFESHVETIEEYAARAVAVAPSLAIDRRDRWPRQTPETEQYAAQVSARSVEIYDASLDAGRPKTADQCWLEAEKEISGAA